MNSLTSACISRLTSLTHLDFHENQGVDDKVLENLTKIDSLKLETCCYGNVTNASVSKLVNLTHLDLTANTDIIAIQNLTNLQILNLDCNDVITDFMLRNITKLMTLILRSTNSQISDSYIKKLTNLTSLDLCYNEKITNYGIFNLNYILIFAKQLISSFLVQYLPF